MKYRAERNKTLFEYSPKDGATASATPATEKSGVSVGSSVTQVVLFVLESIGIVKTNYYQQQPNILNISTGTLSECIVKYSKTTGKIFASFLENIECFQCRTP